MFDESTVESINNAISSTQQVNDIINNVYDTMMQVNDVSQRISQKINQTEYVNIENMNINLGEIFNSYQEINQQQEIYNINLQKGEKKAKSLFDIIQKAASSIKLPSLSDIIDKATGFSDNVINMQGTISYINDGSQSDSELQNKIYNASMNSKTDMGSVLETTGQLSSIGFSNDEAIRYTENLNKMFAAAGAGEAVQTSVTSELVGALADGVVNGEELNSILGTMPEIVVGMADNMNVNIEDMAMLAEQGQLTADVIKSSMIGATDSINQQFAGVKATWSDTMTNIGNMATLAFEPVGVEVSNIINSDSFANLMGGIGNAMAGIANVLTDVLKQIRNKIERVSVFATDVG